jgi:hypothetical protein
VTSVYRVDYSGKLGKMQKTPQGGYRIPATIARVGILEYVDGKGGIVREYNPPDVLLAALDSLMDCPVTNEHPPEHITPANFRTYSAGFVSGSATFKDGMIHAVQAIQDAQLIADIESGTRREVSAGYQAHVDYTPGVTPEGEAYDGIRTRIDFNHVAVVSEGRAGPQVRLVIDSASGNVRTELQNGSANATLENPMTIKFKIDGAEHAAESAQAVFDGALGKRDAAIATLQAKCDAFEKETAAEKKKREAAEAEAEEAKDPKKLDAAVTARVALIESARKVCGKDFKADGKSELVIVSEVAAKAHPKMDLKDKSEAYVRALFDAAITADAADPDGIKLLKGERTDASAEKAKPVETKVETKADARAEMVKRNHELSQKTTTNG